MAPADHRHMSQETENLQDLATLAQQSFVEGYADQLDPDLLVRYAREVFVPELLSDVASGGTEVLLAVEDRRAVGYATVRLTDSAGGRTVRMDRLYVCEGHHRRGHGRRLMERAVALSRSWGATSLCLGVWEANARAIAFYEAMGFSARGQETFDMEGSRQRDVVMCLPLRKG
jgi:diamine N-acetyltransferase